MDNKGANGFPSTKKLAEESGLSERTICTHIEKAAKDGWIQKTIGGVSGQGWKHHKYIPMIPGKALKEVQHLNAEGTEPNAEGTEPNDIKALKEVQSISTLDNSTNNSTKRFTSDSDEIRLSTLLFNSILVRNPKHKKPNIQIWAKHIDRAIRIDKRTPAELEAVIRWIQKSWWQDKILCTESLREKYDRLYMEMKNAGSKSYGNQRETGTVGTKYAHLGTEI